MQLMNKSKNIVLATQVQKAEKMLERMRGLIGKKTLPKGHAMWIKKCNSIHTCFMKFPIDAIFVDKDLKVKWVSHNIKPWMIVFPILGARSVFEFQAGELKQSDVEIGDVLDVGH